MIVQVLKALGEANIDTGAIEGLRQWLSESKRDKVLKDTERVTGWVYAAIKQICREQLDG